MGFTKITDALMTQYPGVIGQAVIPKLSVAEQQAAFEERAEKVLRPAHDRLVDELESEGAAGLIGALTPEGIYSNVQMVILDEVTRAKAAERENAEATAAETDRAKAAEQANAEVITAEVARAKEAEGAASAKAEEAKAAAEQASAAAEEAKEAANGASGEAAAALAEAQAAQQMASAALPAASAVSFLRVISFDPETGTLTTAQGVG